MAKAELLQAAELLDSIDLLLHTAPLDPGLRRLFHQADLAHRSATPIGAREQRGWSLIREELDEAACVLAMTLHQHREHVEADSILSATGIEWRLADDVFRRVGDKLVARDASAAQTRKRKHTPNPPTKPNSTLQRLGGPEV